MHPPAPSSDSDALSAELPGQRDEQSEPPPVRSGPPSTAPRQWPGAPPEPVESRPDESRGLLSDLPATSETRWGVSTYPSIGQNILAWKCFIASFHAVRDLVHSDRVGGQLDDSAT